MFKKILFIVLFLMPSISFAAGFDCKKAGATVEKIICENKELSELDSELNGAYKSVINVYVGKKRIEFVSDQRRWIEEVRNKCENTSCIEHSYLNRIASINDDYRDEFSYVDDCGDAGDKEATDLCLSNLEEEINEKIKKKTDIYLKQVTHEKITDPIELEIDQNIIKAVSESQKVWEQFRELYCDKRIEYEYYHGSGAGQAASKCRILLGKQRLKSVGVQF